MFSTMGFQLSWIRVELREQCADRREANSPLIVVHKVAKAGRVNDSEAQTYTVLLDICGLPSEGTRLDTVGI